VEVSQSVLNERGLDGLHNTPRRGAPPRKLTVKQEAADAE
jgi:hypothetical protein